MQVAPRERAARRAAELLLGRRDGAGAAARVGAAARPRSPASPATTSSRFEPPRDPSKAEQQRRRERAKRRATARDGKLVADKLPLTTDRNGAASFTLKDLPKIDAAERARRRGDLQRPERRDADRRRRGSTLWPSAVVLGVKAGSWASNRGQVKFSVARARHARASRSRARASRCAAGCQPGHQHAQAHGRRLLRLRQPHRGQGPRQRCAAGTTDDARPAAVRGDARHRRPGRADRAGARTRSGNAGRRRRRASGSRKQGELWFAQDNDDRIDVLPEKKRYEPGETARLQVRMPFREATALVAVEREGVIDDAGRDAARRRPDGRAEDRAELGAERLRQRARAARPDPRDAVVLVLHLGLEGAAELGAQRSGTKAASTRRRRRWSTSPSRRSSSASRRSRSASRRTSCRSA